MGLVFCLWDVWAWGVGVVPPLGMEFPPQVASPTEKGEELPSHTSGKPHSICCGMSNKDEEAAKSREQQWNLGGGVVG